MFYAENLQFCMADSNKYIGFINPLVYGSSFFSHNRIPFLAESCIFTQYLTILYFIAQNAYFYTWQCKRPLFLLTFSPRGVKVNKDCDLLHRQV